MPEAERAESAERIDAREPWLPGFAWALPAAFGGAVSACRFEQGDVLHAERSGYGDWKGGAPGPWIQVLDPPRSARVLGSGAESSRFETQWASPVELDLDAGEGAALRRLRTTQGRLFTCLWRGDPAALETGDAPEPPLLLAELQRRLDAALPGLRRALAGGRASGPKSKKRQADAAAMLLATVVDRSSDASLAKADTIAAALASRFVTHAHDARPDDLDVPDAERFHPPLVVRGTRIERADESSVTDALKAALYAPGAKAREAGTGEGEGEAAARADRFSVARHGLLVPLVVPAEAD